LRKANIIAALCFAAVGIQVALIGVPVEVCFGEACATFYPYRDAATIHAVIWAMLGTLILVFGIRHQRKVHRHIRHSL